MAMQLPPLANSLYLAMLQQERQDRERDHQRFLDDDARRNQSMMAVAEYTLKKQAQDQVHERELQKLELQRQHQLQTAAYKEQRQDVRATKGHMVDLYKQRERLAATKEAEGVKATARVGEKTEERQEWEAEQELRVGKTKAYIEKSEAQTRMLKEMGTLKNSFNAAMKLTDEKRKVMDAANKALNKDIMSKQDATLQAAAAAAKAAYDKAAKKSDGLFGMIEEGEKILKMTGGDATGGVTTVAPGTGTEYSFDEYMASQAGGG